MISRARSDGARGCFLVPTRHRAGFWMALRRASFAMQMLSEECCVFEYTRRTGSSSDEEIALVYDQIKGAAAENATRVKIH